MPSLRYCCRVLPPGRSGWPVWPERVSGSAWDCRRGRHGPRAAEPACGRSRKPNRRKTVPACRERVAGGLVLSRALQAPSVPDVCLRDAKGTVIHSNIQPLGMWSLRRWICAARKGTSMPITSPESHLKRARSRTREETCAHCASHKPTGVPPVVAPRREHKHLGR